MSRAISLTIRVLVFCVLLPGLAWYLSQPLGLYFLVYVYEPIFGPPKGAIGLIIWGFTPYLATGVTLVVGLFHVAAKSKSTR